MEKKSLPIIAVASESPTFWSEIQHWPHAGFQMTKAMEAQNPAVLLLGPDVDLQALRHWREIFSEARWLWAKESWSVEDLCAIPPEVLPGYFLDSRDERGRSGVWTQVLLQTQQAPSSAKRTGSELEHLIEFVQEVGRAENIFELLAGLREEMQSFRVVGDPILLLTSPHSQSQLYYCRGSETFSRTLDNVPPESMRVRMHDPLDRQFLANEMGRPFGKVIAFPLAQEKSSGWHIHPYMFFEHTIDDADLPSFISSVAQRLQAVSLVLDRLVFEAELKRTSLLWEKTFDGIEEPIAIIGLNDEIVRSNRRFAALGLNGTEKGVIKGADNLFKIDRFDIRIKDQGPVLSTIVSYQDVTKPMNLRERMIQIEKISAIGHLAGHIAHELNNPLTGIRSLAQILIRDVKQPEALCKDLAEVEAAAKRCQEIILNLLDFSKGNLDSKTLVCDLNDVVKRTLPFLKSALGRLSSQIELQERPLWVEMEPHLMQQVVFNLVNNACQALQVGSGEVEIRTYEESSGDTHSAYLTVKDSGPGVPIELQSVIFEPFFTTKEEGQGTGLGLSFSRDFVRRLGGEITCHSKPGEGALFSVRLPIAKRKMRSEAS